METEKEGLIDRFIWLVFLSLTILTPLIFTNINTELYEVPKMSLVYFGAGLLFTLTVLKFVIKKRLSIPKTPILTFFLIFIGVQIASTITSIDKFTSIYGYPSRLNGGLISQFSYFIVFLTALINLNSQKSLKLIITSVICASTVAIIGILSHFGLDFSCLVLTGNISASCWQAEFNPTLRIFSTLGQPNWLATYLVLTIPASLALLFSSSKGPKKIILSIISISMILALIFTNSRSGFAGLIVALIGFFFLNGQRIIQKNRKLFLSSIAIFIILILTFGSTLFLRLGEFIKRQKNVAGGTETAQIRLIVWQGAVESFKNAPLLGQGPETFAYAYSKYRPTTHNQTTEWNFFYNKAHNEFLNYLSNTGVLGTLAYLAFLSTAIIQILKAAKSKNNLNTTLAKATISAIIGYQTSIFFGFSTVVSQLVMFMLIAQILLLHKINYWEVSLNLGKFFQKVTLVITLVLGLWINILAARIYFADVFFNRSGNLVGEKAISAAFNAIYTFPTQNPFYLSDLSQSTASFSTYAQESQANITFATSADKFANEALKIAPNNFIILRRLINSYILLQTAEPRYKDRLIQLKEKLITLAPTDPQTYLTAAKIEITLSNNKQAKDYLDHSLNLKPDYVEANELLNEVKTVDK